MTKSLADHDNVSVRLMSEYIERAFQAAKDGNCQYACTLVRLAADFEKNVPVEFKL